MRSRGKDPVGDLGTTKLVIFCKLYYIDVLTKKSKQYLVQLVLQMADRYSEMEARTERTPGSASEVLRQGGVISFALRSRWRTILFISIGSFRHGLPQSPPLLYSSYLLSSFSDK